MSIAMPAILVLETAVIFGLLIALARRPRIATLDASIKPPGVMARYVEFVVAGLRAVFASVPAMANDSGSLESVTKAGPSGESRSTNGSVADGSGARGSGDGVSRPRRPIEAKLHWTALARTIGPQAYAHEHDRDGRRTALQDTCAVVPGRQSAMRYFRETLARLPFAILMLGERGSMVAVNPQSAKLFGYECDELIGKPIELLVPDLRFDSNNPIWAAASTLPLSHDITQLHEMPARRKGDTEFRVEIGINEFNFDDDSVMLAFVIDTTDRYELDRNRQDLAHLTRVSTMGELASSLAHELNQPLTAILSNVQAAQRFLAVDDIDLGEVREIMNDIVLDDYRASEVIRRIRAVVKKGDLEVAPLQLADVIREVIPLVHSDAIVRGMRVTLDIDGDHLPSVRGDRVQLQQVILNLLLNAFDAMSNVPPVERVVSVALEPDGPGMMRIAVRDRGHGLTSDRLDTIFKPFFTSKPQGLGLGLSISRSIVDMHRGRIWAENNSDRGATFYVTLPVEGTAGESGTLR
ncbi:sensor histidine kinase [Paraburkholderia sediminicola]|uniref:sensor histidine kinase n=1 Tax=Paraburkholderia sediminicola TaxID=458836 RepID=UPI0038BBF83F